ncbi:conserved hypothetical protein [Desulfarculales bacterium]
MTSERLTSPDLPSMEGAIPARPLDLFRLHRLCLRIYGLMTRDLPAQALGLAQATGPLSKKDRQSLTQTLTDELPMILALHALERLEADQRLASMGLSEFLRGLLLPCFSLSYSQLYGEASDPLKMALARLDWYLDGDKGNPQEALAYFAATMLGDHLVDTGPLLQHIDKHLLPEMDKRLDLAFRYEFA